MSGNEYFRNQCHFHCDNRRYYRVKVTVNIVIVVVGVRKVRCMVAFVSIIGKLISKARSFIVVVSLKIHWKYMYVNSVFLG